MITITPGPGRASMATPAPSTVKPSDRDEHPLRVSADPAEDDDRAAKPEPIPERRRGDRRQLFVGQPFGFAQLAAFASSGRACAGSILMPGPIVDETVTWRRYRPLADAGRARCSSSSTAP